MTVHYSDIWHIQSIIYSVTKSFVPASTKGYVSVEFDRDCKDIVDTDKETTFLNDVQKGIAAKLSLNESEITDMDASCGSIIVNFTIVLSNRTALNASLDKLGQLTRSADLVLQLTDGSVIKVCLWLSF